MNTSQQRRLIGMLAHPASDELLRLRLGQVLGREREIAAIRGLIERQAAAGGYVLLSGGPGAGKSCLIAALIRGDGPERAACHFVALRPAPGYQLGLLRTLVARLALKHALADGYVPATSYPALRDYFAALLLAISERGRREVIYIDGLDQLPADPAGQRDLSFLPATLPPGIVLVLSARPEADGAALGLSVPALRYDVPALGEEDAAALALRHRLRLPLPALRRLAAALGSNPLRLDVAAALLGAPGLPAEAAKGLLAAIVDQPGALFDLALLPPAREDAALWSALVRPLLGLLLAAKAPLALSDLTELLGAGPEETRSALGRAGAIVAADAEGGYALSHLAFHEYLSPPGLLGDDELMGWHGRLADWCLPPAAPQRIWRDADDPAEQRRRVYGRHFALAHLALGRRWDRLWPLLDAGDYGRAKLAWDPSMRLYCEDLDLACAEAAREGTAAERLDRLPRLWRYRLLRGSLASRVDAYPPELFLALADLGRLDEAVSALELMSDPSEAATRWCELAEWGLAQGPPLDPAPFMARARALAHRLGREAGGLLLVRLAELSAAAGAPSQAEALLREAEQLALARGDTCDQDWILSAASKQFAALGLDADAIRLAHAIPTPWIRADELAELAGQLIGRDRADLAQPLLDAALGLGAQVEPRLFDETFAAAIGCRAASGLIDAALAEAGACADPAARAAALRAVASHIGRHNASDRLPGLLTQCRAAAELIGERGARLDSLLKLAALLDALKRPAEALAMIESVFAEAQTIALDSSYECPVRELAAALARHGRGGAALEWAQAAPDSLPFFQHGLVGGLLAGGAWREALAFALRENERAAPAVTSKENERESWRVGSLMDVAGWMIGRGLLAEAPPVLAAVLAMLRDREDWRAVPERLAQIARLLLRIDQRGQAEAVLADALAALHALRPVGDETREIREALAEAGAWPEALALAHREPSLSDQSGALLRLARRAAADAPPETAHAVLADAVATALRIESAAEQLRQLRELAKLLEGAGERELLARLVDGCQAAARRGTPSANLLDAGAAADLLARYLGIDPALAWARAQPDRFLPSCLAGIASAARAGDPERARELLRQAAAAGASLRPEDRETDVIVKGLARLGAIAEALTLARAQDNPRAAIGALVGVRDNARPALDAPQRAALLAELRERTGRLTDPWELSRVAYSLARDVAGAGDLAGAAALLEQIEDEERRSDAADQVAKLLRIAGDFAAARRFADRITSPGRLIQALKEIGLALGAAGEADQARALADELFAFAERQDESQRDHALCAVATLLARLGLADEALAAARRAEEPHYRSWGLLAAAEMLVGAEAGRGLLALDEAFAVTSANNAYRDFILGQLLDQLLGRGEAGRALAAVSAIRSSHGLAQGMAALLAVFPATRDELAVIVEARLARTETRDDALDLIAALLLLNPGAPEFRRACEQGLDWVAAQGIGGAR